MSVEKKGRFGTVKESKLGFVGLYIGRLGSGGVNTEQNKHFSDTNHQATSFKAGFGFGMDSTGKFSFDQVSSESHF